jgi:hypothetical protein
VEAKSVMVQYRTTTRSASHEREYAKLVGDIWEPITEEEARAAGVWEDPRGGQYGVKDELATTGQLEARDKGRYDPRPSSGQFKKTLVKLYCGRCGKHVGDVEQYEKRVLFRSARERTWTRGPSGLKCQDCFDRLEGFHVDMVAINARIATAIEKGRTQHLKLGDTPTT